MPIKRALSPLVKTAIPRETPVPLFVGIPIRSLSLKGRLLKAIR